MAADVAQSGGRVDRWFYVAIALFTVLLSIVGFGPSLIDQSKRNLPPTPLVIAHGVFTGAWFLLFLTQATLAATRRIAVHRRLGVVGPFLAVAMIAVGYEAIFEMMRRGYDLSGDIARGAGPPGSPPPGVVDTWIPLGEFLIFGVLAGMGLWYRHRPAVHRRFMVLALVSLALEPIFHSVGYLSGRWPSLWGVFSTVGSAIQVLLLFASAVNDRVSQGRVHPLSLWGPIAILASVLVLGAVVAPSRLWHEVAVWLAR